MLNTLTSSATFQRLVGENTQAAAKAHCYFDLALDDGTAPSPRAVIRHHGSPNADREGTDSFLGNGEIAIFVQYMQLTDAELKAWYSITDAVSDDDRRRHMNNLFGTIGDEMLLVATDPGCLELRRLEEHSCGYADPKRENGIFLIEMTWIAHFTGQV